MAGRLRPQFDPETQDRLDAEWNRRSFVVERRYLIVIQIVVVFLYLAWIFVDQKLEPRWAHEFLVIRLVVVGLLLLDLLVTWWTKDLLTLRVALAMVPICAGAGISLMLGYVENYFAIYVFGYSLVFWGALVFSWKLSFYVVAYGILLAVFAAVFALQSSPENVDQFVGAFFYVCSATAIVGTFVAIRGRLEYKAFVAIFELGESNRALELLSNTDPLTNLSNRRHVLELLDLEFQRAGRYGISLSLLMADIDHFKKVNDTYGHQVGDIVLSKVASVLSTHRRSTDIVGRFGGEEFIIILPHTPAHGAIEVAERFRTMVAALDFGEDIKPVTLSLGVSFSGNHQATSIHDLIRTADEALYRAKAGGRNRTELFDDEPLTEEI